MVLTVLMAQNFRAEQISSCTHEMCVAFVTPSGFTTPPPATTTTTILTTTTTTTTTNACPDFVSGTNFPEAPYLNFS
jgi:hypothetical protein